VLARDGLCEKLPGFFGLLEQGVWAVGKPEGVDI